MAGGGASRLRKRVEAESSSSSALKRAKDGSAFAKCEECNKDVPVALISFHNCSLDAKIKMNLEAQIVEMPSEAKKKSAPEKRKTKQTEPRTKKEKKAKNPNAPKRPPTAFFVFMEEFRKSYKEANPECKSVAMVAKEGGEKWKSMSDEDKKVYIDRAAELKAEYEKALASNDAENEQDVDDSSEKEVKEEIEADDSSEKEVKEEVEVDGE
ncbi:High mobility group B protein 7 [Sesamum angolense]|uniref:High mobility group B protein 7 n=1 Tax=Sesamum angolense TaxID=2727404 RepID=A0AAE2BW99_9LAMI|nr:High mobility group B protein 7 [Sesamum angolense]